MDDSQLITAAPNDDNAFRQLVAKYYNDMLVVARAIIGDSIADDVVQEAWLSIYKSLDKFEGRSSFKTWAITITANEAKRRLRKESQTTSLEGLIQGMEPSMLERYDDTGRWSKPPTLWHEDSPDSLLSNQELMDCIQHTMGNLNEQQRTALSLKDLEGLSLDEICNIIGVSASNVRVLIHRARQRLFQHIDHFQETGQC
ncbi:hypothetical protein A9Q99_12075 [Gammaproteobacteria bacterium 45_16_T64]|nr:hypothetical protein A9Q99_12075 [Gammaproteobacteria bacterium 45_16_T64]